MALLMEGRSFKLFLTAVYIYVMCIYYAHSKTNGRRFLCSLISQSIRITDQRHHGKAYGASAFIRQGASNGNLPMQLGISNAEEMKAKYGGVTLGRNASSNRAYALKENRNTTSPAISNSASRSMALYSSAPVSSPAVPSSTVGTMIKSTPQSSIPDMKSMLKSVSLLSLWYAGTVMYNIENKKALNMCQLPKTIAALQMLLGIPFFLTRWMVGIKPAPVIYTSNEGVQEVDSKADVLQKIKTRVRNGLCRMKNCIKAYSSLIKQSTMFSMLHLLSVTALGAGAISFVHIVKASEPLFVSAISLLTGSASMSPVTFMTLVPILAGVGMASMKDLNFSPLALASTLLSNVFASLRRIEAKKFFKQDLTKIGQNLDASNISSIVTILSSLILAPLSLLEYSKWGPMYRSLLYKFGTNGLLKVARHVVLSGFFYILYNEVSFIALSQLAPVSHAVANTLKRIFLILTSSILFKTKITQAGVYGSATAITGAMLYSLSKNYFG